MLFFFFFFFSSRRRHTRSLRDWSSDVCSSDLRDAYVRVFSRLGIPAIPAEASNGTMGGSDSIEFVCPSPTGEDLIVRCLNCDYAANIEKATSRRSEEHT